MPQKKKSIKKVPSPKAKKSTGALTLLGKGPTKPVRNLETFPNKYPDRDTTITFHCNEFTCLCPITGQPDFAELEISYIPNKVILESKSLKLYLWTYREVGIFHEELVNELLDALDDCLHSRWMSVTGHFQVRGGIAITVCAERP